MIKDVQKAAVKIDSARYNFYGAVSAGLAAFSGVVGVAMNAPDAGCYGAVGLGTLSMYFANKAGKTQQDGYKPTEKAVKIANVDLFTGRGPVL